MILVTRTHRCTFPWSFSHHVMGIQRIQMALGCESARKEVGSTVTKLCEVAQALLNEPLKSRFSEKYWTGQGTLKTGSHCKTMRSP